LNNRWEKVLDIETNLLIRRFAYQKKNNASKATTSTKQRLKMTILSQNKIDMNFEWK
jgi:hypothetical protein